MGLQPCPLVALDHLYHATNTQELLGRGLLDGADGLNRIHKRCRAAIKNGDFRPAQLNPQIVHAHARQCRHQVLDRRHFEIALTQRGAQPGVGHQGRIDLERGGASQVHALEHDARALRRRPQGHADARPGVQTHTCGRNRRLERSLSNHDDR